MWLWRHSGVLVLRVGSCWDMLFSEGLETKFNMSRHGSMTCEASKSTPIESYRLREMFLLICVSHVYTRHGHDLGKRPCKLSCLLFCLKLACRSAKAQALCQCQIYHLKMKKRMSRLTGPTFVDDLKHLWVQIASL